MQTLHSRLRIAAVDEDMPCGFATDTHKRHLAQLCFHQPFEDHRQPAVDQPYIEHRLVVRYEHIALPLLDMLLALYRHRQKHQPEERTGPELLHFVHKLSIPPMDGTDRENSREDRQHAQYRPCHQILVNYIKWF